MNKIINVEILKELDMMGVKVKPGTLMEATLLDDKSVSIQMGHGSWFDLLSGEYKIILALPSFS